MKLSLAITIAVVIGSWSALAQRPVQSPIDEQRARELYVSNRHEDHPRPDFARQIADKAKEDARYAALCQGILECTKVTYRSRVGDLDIPAYLFQPLDKRGPRGHAAMIWVHGGVHANWTLAPYFPFVKEAVARSAARAVERRPHLQPAGQPRDAGA